MRCGKKTIYPFACRIREFCSHACSNAFKWENMRDRGATASIKCENCAGMFTLLLSQVRAREKASGGKVRYCSMECSRQARRVQAAACEQCRESFVASRSSSRYCSIKCSSGARRKAGPWSLTTPDVDARRDYFRRYTEENRAKINRASAEWAKAHRSYRNYVQQLRRAAGMMTYQEWVELIERAGKCAKCGATSRLEADHIRAVSKGGKTEKTNMQVLCRRCNASKGNR